MISLSIDWGLFRMIAIVASVCVWWGVEPCMLYTANSDVTAECAGRG